MTKECDAWMPREEEENWWTPREIQFALLPMRLTLGKLELVVKMANQKTRLPYISFAEFPSLSNLKLDSQNRHSGPDDRLDLAQ